MAFVRPVMRSALDRTGDPVEALERTNHILVDERRTGLFVTVLARRPRPRHRRLHLRQRRPRDAAPRAAAAGRAALGPGRRPAARRVRAARPDAAVGRDPARRSAGPVHRRASRTPPRPTATRFGDDRLRHTIRDSCDGPREDTCRAVIQAVLTLPGRRRTPPTTSRCSSCGGSPRRRSRRSLAGTRIPLAIAITGWTLRRRRPQDRRRERSTSRHPSGTCRPRRRRATCGGESSACAAAALLAIEQPPRRRWRRRRYRFTEPTPFLFPDLELGLVVLVNMDRETYCTPEQVAWEEAFIAWLEGGEVGDPPEPPAEPEGFELVAFQQKETRQGRGRAAVQGRRPGRPRSGSSMRMRRRSGRAPTPTTRCT